MLNEDDDYEDPDPPTPYEVAKARELQRKILSSVKKATGSRGGRFFLESTPKTATWTCPEYTLYDPEVRYFHNIVDGVLEGPAPSWSVLGSSPALTFILGRSEDNRTEIMECEYLSHDEDMIVFAGEGISRIDSPRAVATSSGWVYCNGKPVTNSAVGAFTHQFEGEDLVYVYVPAKNVPALA